nr:hypothetical protein [Antarcticibacterium flavum]
MDFFNLKKTPVAPNNNIATPKTIAQVEFSVIAALVIIPSTALAASAPINSVIWSVSLPCTASLPKKNNLLWKQR